MVGENAGDGLQMNYWDSKKMGGPSRPKSCEVPNIKFVLFYFSVKSTFKN